MANNKKNMGASDTTKDLVHYIVAHVQENCRKREVINVSTVATTSQQLRRENENTVKKSDIDNYAKFFDELFLLSESQLTFFEEFNKSKELLAEDTNASLIPAKPEAEVYVEFINKLLRISISHLTRYQILEYRVLPKGVATANKRPAEEIQSLELPTSRPLEEEDEAQLDLGAIEQWAKIFQFMAFKTNANIIPQIITNIKERWRKQEVVGVTSTPLIQVELEDEKSMIAKLFELTKYQLTLFDECKACLLSESPVIKETGPVKRKLTQLSSSSIEEQNRIYEYMASNIDQDLIYRIGDNIKERRRKEVDNYVKFLNKLLYLLSYQLILYVEFKTRLESERVTVEKPPADEFRLPTPRPREEEDITEIESEAIEELARLSDSLTFNTDFDLIHQEKGSSGILTTKSKEFQT